MNTFSAKFLLGAVALLWVTGCGFQSIPASKNNIDAATAELTNQYKRRADLIPNVVKTVQRYAEYEKETLTAVMEARAEALKSLTQQGEVQSEKLGKYIAAEERLSSALSQIFALSESYPNLKANESFLDLQVQLEGSENRISVARSRLIEAINDYNQQLTVPPSSFTNKLFYHYEVIPQWDLSPEEKASVQRVPDINLK